MIVSWVRLKERREQHERKDWVILRSLFTQCKWWHLHSTSKTADCFLHEVVLVSVYICCSYDFFLLRWNGYVRCWLLFASSCHSFFVPSSCCFQLANKTWAWSLIENDEEMSTTVHSLCLNFFVSELDVWTSGILMFIYHSWTAPHRYYYTSSHLSSPSLTSQYTTLKLALTQNNAMCYPTNETK